MKRVLSSFSHGFLVSFLQVYGDAYALTLEICRLCANLDRTYRYSLGEELRANAIRMVLDIDTTSGSKREIESIVSAKKRLCEIQLCLRILSDLGSIPRKRHVSFIEMTDNISRQLADRTGIPTSGIRINPSIFSQLFQVSR